MNDWRAQGACKGYPADMFFPERGDHGAIARARLVCAGCPVTDQCLEFALANFEKFGVWGGKSERERRQLRRKQWDGQRFTSVRSENRKRQARLLAEQGASREEIAHRLGVSLHSVRDYLNREAS